MIPFMTLWHYFRIRRLHFANRKTLEAYQVKKLQQFSQQVLANSPWFRRYASQPITAWPLMDKQLMMEHFDVMNTQGLHRDVLMACALGSEQDRDFSRQTGKFSVGLSSGTSGNVVSLWSALKNSNSGRGAFWLKCCPMAYSRVSVWRYFCGRIITFTKVLTTVG